MCWPLLTDTNLCNCINLQLQLHLPLSLSQGGSSFSVNKIMDCMTFSCIYNYSLYRQLESHTNKHNNNLMACMKTGCYKPLVPCWLVTQTQRHTHTQPPPFVTIADKLLSAIQKQLHTHTFTHTYTTNSKGRDLFFCWWHVSTCGAKLNGLGPLDLSQVVSPFFVCTCLRKTKRKKESVKDKWKDFFLLPTH